SQVMRVDAPLASTTFTVSGDRFLAFWGEEIEVSSPVVSPHAVDAHVDAEQSTREADNEVVNSTGQLGGSAPCDVAFKAAVSEGALFTEWQFSRTPDFDDINLRITDLRFDYSFTEEGTTYVRFVCADRDAICEWESQPFEISIGQSMLKCPNAFSPANEDGVNDIWKVTYSSIVDFECSIFNRSGHCLFTFTNPADGWDGRYGGKFVPSGVYFYVIKARGADGKNYNLSGDINIVGYK
ncbi:MAG: gliding motility-associated C-terminal domain-containing protein, partial [Duncaniella sp.]|nr:gliding motility-associated C-terminal domain-containing protein [Duncaniella sp.]